MTTSIARAKRCAAGLCLGKLGNLLSLETGEQGDAIESLTADLAEENLEERPAGDREKRLRRARRQLPQARAHSSAEDYGPAWRLGHG